jgi:flagella basal body P-ring formation protein FlgA
MMRALLLAAVAAIAFAAPAEAGPSLKPVARVASGIVTVGDLVAEAGPFAGLPLYRSPDLGTTGTVPVGDILARVRALGLAGIDTGGLAEVVVSRLATDVTAADLARHVAAAVAPRLGTTPEQIEVSFDQTPNGAKADSAAAQPARLVDLSLTPGSGRFDAVVEIDKGGPVERLRLRGQATEMVDVLMLTRPLQKGDVVLASDLTPQRLPRAQADRYGQIDAAQLIGKEAKRPLRANVPVLAADFTAARIVAKGDLVTIVVEMPGLMLTVRGLAQEAGTLGDQIAVMNEQSRRMVHAEVSGPGRVVIRRPGMPGAALASLERNAP